MKLLLIKVSMVLIFLLLLVTAIVPGIYGLVLAFKASIIFGIMAFIIEPSPILPQVITANALLLSITDL